LVPHNTLNSKMLGDAFLFMWNGLGTPL
jgi:hypothetical protein